MTATQNTVVLLAPEDACGILSLEGQSIEIPENRMVQVPAHLTEQLLQHHGFTRPPWAPRPDAELSKMVDRRTHLEERKKTLEESIAKTDKEHGKLTAHLAKLKDDLAEGETDVHQVAECTSKCQALETKADTLRKALGKVEPELAEVGQKIQEEERGRMALHHNAAAEELREEAERIVEAFVASVSAPREILESLAGLERLRREQLPLADPLPVVKVSDLARRVEEAWGEKDSAIRGSNVLTFVMSLLFGPGRTDKATWPERFRVQAD